ncbi:MAG TPA: arginase family protein [Ohtaekwangia sp.]|nr:arginase family protein [Ohtaekwangia sp.]
MMFNPEDIQIISAPSILGLKPNGVEDLGNGLLASGLAEVLGVKHELICTDTLNDTYSVAREATTNMLNPRAIRDFSLTLGKVVWDTMTKERFPLILGGDCSILIGIMSGLKAKRNCGLIFLDAHADFYRPEQSITGEAADMDLAIVTGRGPELLTNINDHRPYVKDEHVIHVGQRDWEKTQTHGSEDIRKASIKCFSLAEIGKRGIAGATHEILTHINEITVDGFWIHYDLDVLSDEINPAVDYRLPEGLQFEEVEYLIRKLLKTGRMMGVSITIFNPRLDKDGNISKNITTSLGKAFGLSAY